MNSYIHHVNRFLLLLIAVLLCVSCEKKEVSCSDNDIPVHDTQLLIRSADINNSDSRQTYYLSDSEEVTLCDSSILSGINHSEYEIGIDSAVFRHCDECLELLEWSGPGCDRGFIQTNESHELINTVWKLSEVSMDGDTHFTPCFLEVQVVLNDDGTAGFNLRNSYLVSYALINQQITFSDPVGTLVRVFGYNQFIEDLFRDQLFCDALFLYELSGNQLILAGEDELQFIFYAE